MGKTVKMSSKKRIALIAHDRMKKDLAEWVLFNKGTLSKHELFATGTTGAMIEEITGLKVTKFKSGPLGGDQQIGAKIAEGEIDILIFFWDPLEPLAHDVDIKALIRLATVYNIPVAINRSTADFLISSPLMHGEYEKIQPDYETQLSRRIQQVISESE
ncbi:methylglyoxal synthase [Pseudothermotoga thermarum]|uniref:Methylglyoxal synthase n=1 Tax=Pseudothermotoga thermarum DSM 5069 TaxID=688269 RepID=F7YW25_9THEM|nr:methylglyoxal synthase [Pseudothermotoga thermarum]AEH50512.1 methylglyoxal synthase [Pseudothermotoga thermarum DSM 5069]